MAEAFGLVARVLSEGNGSGNGTGTGPDYDYEDGQNPRCFQGSDVCCCPGWSESYGSEFENQMAIAMQWVAFALSIIILIFYGYQTYKATCGWEEIYVCTVELVKVTLESFLEYKEPATLFMANGNRVAWIKYGEWLLTCPVILIHLSNVTGLSESYSPRTMKLLISDLGCVVMGITAALADPSWVKVIFFLFGCIYGANTYFNAALAFIEAYHTVPKGRCRNLVRLVAWLFFGSWAAYPLLFVLGPEGFGHLSWHGSVIATTIVDMLAKNVWGFVAHWLRIKIREHIILHGDIREKKQLTVGGQPLEVDQFVEEETEDTVKNVAKHIQKRDSFIMMRDQMKARGLPVRASMDGDRGDMENDKMDGMAPQDGTITTFKPMMEKGAIEPGRVILTVPDVTMVDFFREQFNALPASVELVPAFGPDNTLQIVQQAVGLGGCDFLLLHPEFLRDKTPGNLVSRLRMMGQRVCAFGWAPAGPMREMIESAGLDGWLEGPSFGAGINQSQLSQLVAQMQALKRSQMMSQNMQGFDNSMQGGMFGGGVMNMGGMQGMGMGMGMGGSQGMGMQGGMQSMGGMQQLRNSASLNMNQAPQGGLSSPMNRGLQPQQSVNNPLYNIQMSPMQSTSNLSLPPQSPGGQGMGSASLSHGMATPQTPTGGSNLSEAEMLQQLMSEISRLKNELGDGR